MQLSLVLCSQFGFSQNSSIPTTRDSRSCQSSKLSMPKVRMRKKTQLSLNASHSLRTTLYLSLRWRRQSQLSVILTLNPQPNLTNNLLWTPPPGLLKKNFHKWTRKLMPASILQHKWTRKSLEAMTRHLFPPMDWPSDFGRNEPTSRDWFFREMMIFISHRRVPFWLKLTLIASKIYQ